MLPINTRRAISHFPALFRTEIAIGRDNNIFLLISKRPERRTTALGFIPDNYPSPCPTGHLNSVGNQRELPPIRENHQPAARPRRTKCATHPFRAPKHVRPLIATVVLKLGINTLRISHDVFFRRHHTTRRCPQPSGRIWRIRNYSIIHARTTLRQKIKAISANNFAHLLPFLKSTCYFFFDFDFIPPVAPKGARIETIELFLHSILPPLNTAGFFYASAGFVAAKSSLGNISSSGTSSTP